MADSAEDQRTGQEPDAVAPVVPAKERLGRRIGRGALLVWIVLVVVFALANVQSVEFNWIFGRSEIVEVAGQRSGGVPLVLLLAGAFAGGHATGWLTTVLRARRRRRATQR